MQATPAERVVPSSNTETRGRALEALRAQAAEDPRFLRGCNSSTQTDRWAWRRQALEARLAAAEGEAVDVAALVEAYLVAANMFAGMRDSLSETQVEYIATILAEVAGVVAAFTE